MAAFVGVIGLSLRRLSSFLQRNMSDIICLISLDDRNPGPGLVTCNADLYRLDLQRLKHGQGVWVQSTKSLSKAMLHIDS